MGSHILNNMGMLYRLNKRQYRQFLLAMIDDQLSVDQALERNGTFHGVITQNVTDWTRDDAISAYSAEL